MASEVVKVGKSKATPKFAKSVAKSAGTRKSNRVANQPKVQKSTFNKPIELVSEEEDTKFEEVLGQETQRSSASETKKSMASDKRATNESERACESETASEKESGSDEKQTRANKDVLSLESPRDVIESSDLKEV